MNFYAQTSNSVSNILLWLPLIISLLLLQCLANSSQNTSVGVIIDFNSVTGKQQRTAMQIATQNFNNYSNTHNLILFFKDSGRNPLQTASAGEHYLMKNIYFFFSFFKLFLNSSSVKSFMFFSHLIKIVSITFLKCPFVYACVQLRLFILHDKFIILIKSILKKKIVNVCSNLK